MTYIEATLRLLNHANLVSDPQTEEESRHESFLFVLYQAEKDQKPPNLDPLFEDIVVCLEVVNQELNGTIPSQTTTAKDSDISRHLVGAVSGIITGGLYCYQQWVEKDPFDLITRNYLSRIIWCISHAWDQLLAGDIDNLREDVDMALLSL